MQTGSLLQTRAIPATFALKPHSRLRELAAGAPRRVAARKRPQAATSQAHQTEQRLGSSGSADVVVVQPEEKKVEWWQRLHAKNLVTVHTAQQLRRVLQRAHDLGTTRLVVVEFFGPHCPACRTLYPKLVQLAKEEFPELLFVKLNVTGTEEAALLCQELGVETLPTFQLYSGALGRVAQFTASLNSASLERLRTMLRVHSFQRTSFVPGQRGPASVFHADGWPAIVRPVPGSVSGSGADAAGRP